MYSRIIKYADKLVKVAYYTIKQKTQWAKISFPFEHTQSMLRLYDKYAADLQLVRASQSKFYEQGMKCGLHPQLCDIESELTYLRIREYRPPVVIEFSPASGWSTSWILHALRDNGAGELYSFDLVETSKNVLDPELTNGRWHLIIGDVVQNLKQFPRNATYLFIDSAHTGEFADWYINNVFPLFPAGTNVSVHDILKYRYQPGCGPESEVLCDWLSINRIACTTASRALKKKGYSAYMKKKRDLKLDAAIHTSDYNSMIFFQI